MHPDVLVSLIGLGGSAIGSLVGISLNSKMSNYRIEQLEKKVEKHNQLVERTYELEKREDVQEEKLKVANHRIDDLEEKEKNNDIHKGNS